MGSSAEAEAIFARYDLDRGQRRQLLALAHRLADDPRAPTSVSGRQHSLRRHLADSLVALELEVVRSAKRIADVGSGAGLPGLVLATALPASEVALIESQESKCSFIAARLAELRLENVRVVCSRAELWSDGLEASDLVVTRALAAQPVVVELAAPLLREGGSLVEWRGRRDHEEEIRADRAAAVLAMARTAVLHVQPFPGAVDRHLHVFEKTGPTPAGYPRRPGVASKRPLGA